MKIERWIRAIAFFACLPLISIGGRVDAQPNHYPDIRSVEADLSVPTMVDLEPAAGLRIRRSMEGWNHEKVYHSLYLPKDWASGEKLPIIVEYTGNGGYRDALGDICSGRPEDSCLGYGMSTGVGYIWICLPFLNAAGSEITEKWWGDAPQYDPKPTLNYLHAAIADTCMQFGGDSSRIFLCGFSRGSIACNFLGLHDEKTAKLWRAFVAYSHYDGVRNWPYPNSDADSAVLRLERLNSRPQFICGEKDQIEETRRYLDLGQKASSANLTFASTGFQNHNDAWILRPSKTRQQLRNWLQSVVRNDGPAELAYPDHSQLLVVRDAAGNVRPVKTKADWAERVSHIRANMQLVMGKLPDSARRVPLDLVVVSEEQLPKYRRQKILFTPEPNDRVPAWLLIPNELPESGKIAAMVCLHQTTNIGKDEPVGLGGSASLHYAHELAERGYLCLVPDYPSFGEYAYDFKTKGANYASGSMKAIWNNIRAVDLLESLPQVDKNRIGAIGHSLGGHNGLFTAVFDERLKAVVSSCGFTPFHDYYNGKLVGWTSDRYMPRIRDIYENNADKVPFDFYEIIAALAPRGLYSNSPVNDDNFDVSGVRKAFAKAEEVYALFTIPKSGPSAMPLMLSTPNAPHDFPKSERDAAYHWLDRMLGFPSVNSSP